MDRKLTCIICPRGCALTATVTGSTVTVTGNACPKGEEYATAECIAPVRTVTATVCVSNRENTVAAVKTAAPIPKDKIFALLAALQEISITAPAAIGDVVAKDLCGTDVVLTREVL